MKRNINNSNNNREVYEELAEKRAIEKLKLTEKEVITAKAYETTKIVELDNIYRKAEKRQHQYMPKPRLWSILFK